MIKRTNALCKIGAIEKTVFGKSIEIALHFVPSINAIGFTANKF
jgi:hypothetical protein